MSIKALNWAFSHEETFQSSQRFVLVALANFASETGKSYPQVATICHLTGLQDATVRNALKDLVEAKIIADTGKRAGPTQQVKVYQLPEGACELKTSENGGLKTIERPMRRPQEDSKKTPENGEQSLTRTSNHKPEKGGANAPTVAKQKQERNNATDENWLFEIAASEAYRGIDVRREVAKAKLWIENNPSKGRRLNKRFVMNWLNRCDPTLQLNGAPKSKWGPYQA